ncbi:MAG: PepSY domain-containing protein [Chromatiaceae bacterium]|jgi:uncharacterized membrane protein YkoI|nr:PepSY domain-containing protein [Chromatiaceae bacterium]
MKSVRRSVISITVTGVLTGTALAALADTAKGKPFEGVVVEDVVVVEQFPTEVQSGSVQVKDDSETALLARAKITSGEAARIAEKALPGKAVETRLDEENGYLVWEVEIAGDQGQETQLKIDAGDGRLLAVEADRKGEHEDENDRDEEKHSGWKFWEEDHDRDDRDDERS